MFINKLIKRVLDPLKSIPHEIYVFLAVFIYRLPALGYDFINNDAFHWKERGYAFGSALTSLDFAGTAVTYHPGVPLLWCQFIAIKVYSILLKLGAISYSNSHDEFLVNNQIQTIVVVFLTSILLTVAFRKLKKMFGLKFALLVILIVSLEPFYLALARALHTDAILSLFMFISILYFYSSITDDSKKLLSRDTILCGTFAGLAFLTKSSALFLIPFFILIGGIYFWKSRSLNTIMKTSAVILVSIISFFVFWPAMWVQPIESISLYLFKGVQGTAIEEGHEHIWFGKATSDPGPLFYPVVLVARYSLILFVPLLISLYLVFRNRKKILPDRETGFIGSQLLFLIFYLLMITLVSKKLDRYSLPIVFPLSIIAVWVILKVLKDKAILVFVGILLLIRAIQLYSIHPNYLAYYSPLVGGNDKGRYLVEPKWLVGYDKVAEYFNSQGDKKDTFRVAIADFDYLRPLAEFEVLNIKHEVERNEANYFVLPVFRPERNLYYKNTYNLNEHESVIKIGRVEYYYIYKVGAEEITR